MLPGAALITDIPNRSNSGENGLPNVSSRLDGHVGLEFGFCNLVAYLLGCSCDIGLGFHFQLFLC